MLSPKALFERASVLRKKCALFTYNLRQHGVFHVPAGLFFLLFPRKLRDYDVYRSALSDKTGLEIGGPTRLFRRGNILPIYDIARRVTISNLSADDPSVDMRCDATDLSAIGSGTLDFVASSHTLEHLANPMKALREWLRVIREGGHLLLVLPHKDATFDHLRPPTSLEHLLEDLDSDVGENDVTHVEETLSLADQRLCFPHPDEASFVNSVRNSYSDRSLHHHCFDVPLVVRMFDHLGLSIISLDLIFPFHIIVLGRRSCPGSGVAPDNSRFMRGKFRFY